MIKRQKTGLALLLVVAILILGSMFIPSHSNYSVAGTFQKVITVGMSGVAYAAGIPDYTCDGVADDVQVQQAVNDLPTAGGEVHLLAGSYSFDTTVLRNINNIVISGAGKATSITHDGATPLFSTGVQTGWVFKDLSVDAGGITRSATSYVVNCWINSALTNDLIDDTPTNGILAEGVSSNWAYDYSHTEPVITVYASNALNKPTGNLVGVYYVCDGTADDVQINAALDACGAAGEGSVCLSDGKFYISTSILIPKYPAKITMYGQGQATQLVPDGSLADHVIKSKAVSDRTMNCTLRDFGIDGDIGGGDAQTAGGGIYLWGASYSRLINLTIMDCFADGIKLDGNGTWTSADAVIRGCKINSNGGAGIYTQPHQGDITIDDCNIYLNGVSGISCSSGGAIISNNRIYGNTGNGIYTTGWWTVIANNNISQNTVQGISVLSVAVIVGNVFRANSQYGVYLGASAVADGTIVEDNWFGSNVVGEVGGTFTNRIVQGNQGFHGEQDVDDTAVDGATTAPISSNWAYDHEKWGNSTITSGNTSVVVTHNCSITPTAVVITPRGNTTAAVRLWWVDTVGAATFTVHTDIDPSTSGFAFYWVALVR